MMDLYCRHCGEPWDHDSLHEEAAARYGVPYYIEDETRDWWLGSKRERNPAYDPAAYGLVYKAVSEEFRTKGCAAFASYGGHCNAASTKTDSAFGLTRQEAAGALYDLLGDDTDGAAAMLDDLDF